jgi:hypothetical protein
MMGFVLIKMYPFEIGGKIQSLSKIMKIIYECFEE